MNWKAGWFALWIFFFCNCKEIYLKLYFFYSIQVMFLCGTAKKLVADWKHMFAKKNCCNKNENENEQPNFFIEIEIETKKKNWIQLEHGSNFILMTKRWIREDNELIFFLNCEIWALLE